VLRIRFAICSVVVVNADRLCLIVVMSAVANQTILNTDLLFFGRIYHSFVCACPHDLLEAMNTPRMEEEEDTAARVVVWQTCCSPGSLQNPTS